MQKIPTLFVRDFDHSNGRYVTEEVTPGCEWVLAGEGVPTRKYDGTCVLIRRDGMGVKAFARREVKAGKEAPAGFVLIETDETTGKSVGWEPAEQSGFWKFIEEALVGNELIVPGTYELVGPKIQGNPENSGAHVLVPHDRAMRLVGMKDGFNCPEPPTFDTLREFMQSDAFTLVHEDGQVTRFEGIVWHHPDGRMAKIKVRDFPRA